MKQLGTYLADTLTEDGQISKEQQAIYAYLFDYLIEALLYDIVVLIIGLLVHRLDLTLCYLLVTIPLRHFAGGFHANTRLGCTILSYGIYLITIFSCSLILKHIKKLFHRCLITCFILTILTGFLYLHHQITYCGIIMLCMVEGVISVYIGIWKNRRNL